MKQTILSMLIVLCTLLTHGQKVGLVLSGGGAKGIAHIGLIQVLEENNIPIDYVAGTSIGAIVAGLYASGMSPQEMLLLFNSDDFRLWSTGRMDKDDLYYFKRNDEMPEWIKLDIARKEDKIKLVFPMNIVPERQMDFAFLQLTSQTTAVCDGDFDKLFVPFRCVSTDIYNNRAIIHDSDDLGEAIRASMTFPLVYKPIEKDGSLLFDGGIVNNFPLDVMVEEFAPDIVIGHKVTDLGKKPDPDDFFRQIETMVTQITRYELPDSLGIVFDSPLNDVGLLDFQKANYIYAKGVQTGKQYIDSIKSRITRRVDVETVDSLRNIFVSQKPEMMFGNVQVEGVKSAMQRRYIIESIKNKEATIDLPHLRASYFKLIADDHIKSIRPIAYYNRQTGLFDLHLKVEPRKPLDVEFGGNLTTQSSTFGFLQANYKTFKNRSYKFTSNVYFGRFYSSFLLGGRVETPSKTPYYISTFFTYNVWDYFTTSTDLIFTDIRPSYMRQSENNIRLEIGFPYTKTGVIDFGLSTANSSDQYYQTKVFNQGDIFDQTSFNAYTAHVRIDKKNYDFKQYPVHGGRKLFSLHYINGVEEFTAGTTAPIKQNMSSRHSYFQIRGLFDQYYPFINFFRAGLYGEAVFNNNTLFSNYTSTVLNSPGFHPTPNSKAYFYDNYRANQYFAAGAKLIYEFNQSLHARTEVYGYFPIQEILALNDNTVEYNEKIFTTAHFMGLAALVYHTRLGPISAELNFYDKVGKKWFFGVSMGYMLFNKRGF